MGANSNGTPTSLGIPTLSPTQDNLNALGINEITNAVDAKIAGRMFAPVAPSDKQVVKWNNAGSAWIASFVSPSELAQQAATTGQVMLWNGSQWGPGSPGAIYRKTTVSTVNTTVAPTDLLAASCTIGAGVMGATGVLRLTAFGDYLNNTGSANPPFFTITLGGTTMINPGAAALADVSAVRYGWRLVCEIMNLTTGSQVVDLEYSLKATNFGTLGNNAYTTGEGKTQTTSASLISQGVNSGLAVDTTAARVLQLLVTNGSAGATTETKLFGAFVELL